MKIRSKSPTTRVINAPDGPIEVGPGDTVEVDDELAKALLEQSDRWDKPAGKKSSTVTSEES